LIGTLSGSGMASTVLLGRTLLPEMMKQGYDRKLTMGLSLSGGLMSILIPPSGLLIMMGVIGQISVGALLIGGIFPGLLLGALSLTFVVLMIRVKPSLAPVYRSERVQTSDKLRSTVKALPFLIIIFAVLGVMMLGIATPSEAAGTGAFMSILMALAYRKLRLKQFMRTMTGGMEATSMILIIIASSMSFSQFMALSGVTASFGNFVVSFATPPFITVIIMLFVCLLLGLFFDQISIMVITLPIFMPVVKILGVDPIWFGLIYGTCVSIGGLTPPFGMQLFAMKGVVDSPMGEIYSSTMPFVGIALFLVVLCLIFPGITTWLPSLMVHQ
jgi:tripartite ATP-independent transporter DctM subunit